MKRLSVLLIVTLLAGTVSGCRYAVVEDDALRVLGGAALAEGSTLFKIEEPDLSFLDDLPYMPTVKPAETPDPTPVPTKMPKVKVTPEPTVEAVIGLHSRDEEGESKVRKAQQRLYDLGYLDVEPDGIFGARTLRALMRFQEEKGLEQTGVLDDATRLALYPQPEATTSPEDVLYAEGSFGREIRLAHRKLRQYGFSARALSSRYDEATAEEIMAFQEYAVANYGTEFDDPLPETAGLTASDAAVETAARTAESAFGIPEMPVLEPEATLRPYHATDGVISENLYNYLLSDRFPVYRRTVQRSDYGVEVERVQRRLITLDYYYESVTGEYDDATIAAMKSFQKRNGFQETGIADAETQQRLFSDDAVAAERVDQPFYIKVSLDDQRVYVYRWSEGGYNQLIKTMICSTGYGTSTPKGVFVSPGQRDARWHYFVEYNCWAQYAFIIRGSILFHSVIYSAKDESTLRRSTLENLGHKASHGCVRLKVEDARWIYEHCTAGQVIEIY